ncbi:MAG: glycosyltransferase family 2 protein, partial [Candidatus Omnitrophota bacterium]
ATHTPFRLIIVDNASDRETAQYLESARERNPKAVTLIRNAENMGFIKAVNQGIEESRAPYVCLLNNDTQVASGWLEEMLEVAETKEDIGIVNPNSNTFGLNPKRGQSLESLAQELASHKGEYSEMPWAIGFCMLIKRKVIDEIGLFDEIYGRGNFEDADFSKRAKSLKYNSVCAKAAYVYHRQRRSFIKFKSFKQDFGRNRDIFQAKWGMMQRLLYVLTRDDSAYIEKIATEALRLAGQGNIVWIFLSGRMGFLRKRFDNCFNVFVYILPENFFKVVSIWRIVKRKKKFDRIYVDDENYGKRLNSFKKFHRAEVIYGK